jgi:hypothetical protein
VGAVVRLFDEAKHGELQEEVLEVAADLCARRSSVH